MKLREPTYVLDALLESGKLGDGSRVIYSGSETARGIKSMGYPVPSLTQDADHFIGLLTGSGYSKALSKSELDNAVYAHCSAIGALFIAAFARRRPEVYFAVVSPGLTPDSLNPHIARHLGDTWPGWLQLFGLRMVYPLMQRAGTAHGTEVAAKYYVDGLTADGGRWRYPSGAFVGHMPPTDVSGPQCNQVETPDGAFLADQALQDLAWAAVRKYVTAHHPPSVTLDA